MPVVLLERLPLPSLKTYTTISVTLLACAVHYASQVVTERQAELEQASKNASSHARATSNNSNDSTPAFDTGQAFVTTAVNVLLDETWCVWTLINMAYCCLILVGKVIQGAVFGQLRVSEHQRVKDKFWNFVFYKFIFIFGVLNVQHMDEVMLWSAWFSMLGFLHLLSQLCKDRFEYLSFSPTTPGTTHAKVLLLLASILAMGGALFVLCFLVGFMAGFNIFAFMIAECALLAIKTLYVLVRYAIHLWDMHYDGVWENRALFVYWSEFSAEIASLAIDFCHHLHMLVWSNIFLSMASLVICMQLRYLFHEGQRRLRRHKNYLRVVNSMQARFPMATHEEIDVNNDDCAICWDKMDSARKLPCSHLFHDSCLRSWLEQDTSCPTCRTSLSDPQDEIQQPTPAARAGVPGATPPLPGNPGRPPHHPTTNHFFHFDGSRYVSWFPSFSVEVTHTPILGNGPPTAQIQTSQLDNMARDVRSVFPGMPLNIITDDLRVTRSVEVTIENILEGVLVAPPQPSSSFSGTNGGSDAPSMPNLLDEPVTVIAPATSLLTDSSTDVGLGSTSGGDVGWTRDHIVMSSNRNINFITDENIPDLTSDLEDELDERYSASAPGTGSGARFSKSPVERHSMLMQRKESLLEVARRKFLDHYPVESESESADGEGASRDALSYHEDQADLDSLGVTSCNVSSNIVMSADETPSYMTSDNATFGMSEGLTSDDVCMRRERAYRAARRRMQQSNR